MIFCYEFISSQMLHDQIFIICNSTMTIQSSLKHHKGQPYPRLCKAIVALLIIIGFLLYRFLFTQPNVICIYDAYHQATQKDNRDFVTSPGPAYEGNMNQLTVAGKAVIGTGQVLMDLWIGVFGILWLIKIQNVRAFGAIAGFYLTRSVIFLNIQKFPYPNDIAWRSPGFFSFTVPYDHTRDFFYSGHTGGLTVIFLQMCILQLKIPSSLAFLSLVYMMNMLLITKVHYVIDIIGGLLFAIWYHRSATRAVIYIDKLLSLPYFCVKWLYVNKCNGCKQQQEQETNENNKDVFESVQKIKNNFEKKQMFNQLIQIPNHDQPIQNKNMNEQ